MFLSMCQGGGEEKSKGNVGVIHKVVLARTVVKTILFLR